MNLLQDRILQGDALTVLRTLPDTSIQCCVSSPPYYNLRDYGIEGQIGLEETPGEFVQNLVEVFREVRRVLKDDGTLWINMGDSYAGAGDRRGGKGDEQGQQKKKATPSKSIGLKPKDLIGTPWMLAFALRDDGWWLRSPIIWHKPNAMPESVRDRPSMDYEHLFLLAKSQHYYYNADAIREPHTQPWRSGKQEKRYNPHLETHEHLVHGGFGRGKYTERVYHPDGRNKRTVWSLNTQPFPSAHFATFPLALVEPCILAGSRPGDLVLDPFSGAATVPLCATKLGRHYLGIELNPEYVTLSHNRLERELGLWKAS